MLGNEPITVGSFFVGKNWKSEKTCDNCIVNNVSFTKIVCNQ